MEVRRTVRVKLDVPNDRRADLHATLRQFNVAANYTIEHGRNDAGTLILDEATIHDQVCYDLRERTELPANLCIRAYTTALEAMRCDYSVDGDYNAAKNIGLRLLTVPEGERPSGLGDGQLALKSGTMNGNGSYSPSDAESADRESTGKSTTSVVGR